jgi:hypothetical protein
MKKVLINGLFLLALCGLAANASQENKSKMHFYRGPAVPNLYIAVISHTSTVIEFKIRAYFGGTHLYHLVLDGDEPLSEGWYPTSRVQTESYTVKMKAKKKRVFEPGKKYRLCIGDQSPELVYARSSNNYQCIVEYEFVLDEQ